MQTPVLGSLSRTLETKTKMSLTRLDLKHTEEAKEKMSKEKLVSSPNKSIPALFISLGGNDCPPSCWSHYDYPAVLAQSARSMGLGAYIYIYITGASARIFPVGKFCINIYIYSILKVGAGSTRRGGGWPRSKPDISMRKKL